MPTATPCRLSRQRRRACHEVAGHGPFARIYDLTSQDRERPVRQPVRQPTDKRVERGTWARACRVQPQPTFAPSRLKPSPVRLSACSGRSHSPSPRPLSSLRTNVLSRISSPNNFTASTSSPPTLARLRTGCRGAEAGEHHHHQRHEGLSAPTPREERPQFHNRSYLASSLVLPSGVTSFQECAAPHVHQHDHFCARLPTVGHVHASGVWRPLDAAVTPTCQSDLGARALRDPRVRSKQATEGCQELRRYDARLA